MATDIKLQCANCGGASKFSTVTKTETLTVFSQPIEIESEVRICGDCGADLFDGELGDKNLSKAYDIYRKKHSIISSEEAREVRKTYNLSLEDMSLILDCSPFTVENYEAAALIRLEHSNTYRSLKDPEKAIDIFGRKKACLSEKTYNEAIHLAQYSIEGEGLMDYKHNYRLNGIFESNLSIGEFAIHLAQVAEMHSFAYGGQLIEVDDEGNPIKIQETGEDIDDDTVAPIDKAILNLMIAECEIDCGEDARENLLEAIGIITNIYNGLNRKENID